MSEKKRLTIGLISAAGSGNYGDELIRKLWLQFYKKHSVVDISFLPLDGGQSSSYTFVDKAKLWDLEYTFPGVDLIHFIGGGYINDEFNTISKYTEALRGRKKEIPLVASGVSLQPSSISNLNDFLNQNWELIGLRDLTSFSHARKVLGRRASFSFDDTWKFPLKNAMKKVNRKERTIFINLQEQFDLEVETEYLTIVEKVIDIIKKLHKMEPNLVVVVIEAHKSDTRLATELENVKIKSRVLSANEWLETGVEYSKSDILITSRFHPRLLFSRVGVPVKTIVVGNYYQHKHGDSSGRIFPHSDFDLESEFSLFRNGISYTLWKTRCFAKANLYKFHLVLILWRIRITQRLKGYRN